jgi:hypothetical protein
MFDKLLNKLYQTLDTPERKERLRLKVKEALEEAYNNGYKTAEEIGQEAIKAKENDLIDEYSILLATKNSELIQARKMIKDYQDQLRNAKRAYKSYYHDAVANKKLIAEVAVQIQRLFDASGDIYKSFISIQDSAQDHFDLMLKKDPLNRNLLGITQIPDNGIENKTILSEQELNETLEAINNMSPKSLKEKNNENNN